MKVTCIRICLSTVFALFLIQPNFSQNTTNLDKSRWVYLSDSLFNLKKNEEALALLLAEQTRLILKNDTIGQNFLVISYALGRHYYKRRDYPIAFPYFEKALALQESIKSDNFADLADILSCTGLSAMRASPPQSASYMERALEINIKLYGENSYETASSYNDLGRLYGFILEDFEKGEAYFAKSVRVLKAAGLEKHMDYIGFSRNLISILMEEDMHIEALHQLLELQPIMREKFGVSNQMGITLSMVGECYGELADFEKALLYLHYAVEMFEKVETPDKTYLANGLSYLASAYNTLKKPDSALIYINKSRKLSLTNVPNKQKLIPSGLCWQYAAAYGQTQQIDVAITYMDSAFMEEEYLPSTPFDSIRTPHYISLLLMEKTKYLLLKHDYNRDISTLEAARQTLNLAQDINSRLVSRFQNTRSKLSAYRELYKGFELSNQTLLTFYDRTGDIKYLREAFTASETSKSLLLYQQILEHKNRQKAKVPLDLAQRAADIQSKIVQSEKQLFEKRQSAQSAEREALQEAIFILNKQYETLKNEIKVVCPDYFLDNPPLPQTDLSALQNSLSANEAVLEFFTGDSTITAFLVRHDTLIHYQITPKKEVEARVKTFREAVTDYFLSETKSPTLYLSTATSYAEAAYWLYQTLIMPKQAYMPENLTIIPDGILAYLPFEALLTAKPERPDRFHTHAYWNQKHALHYSYSAALMLEMDKKHPTRAPQSLLAMAPFYDGSTPWHDSLSRQRADQNRAEFTPLPFSGEEVFKVAKLSGGKALTGKMATKADFLREADQYRILHLATHARANDRAGDYSFICFAPTPEYPQGERLYVSEIYGLRLNADLVVLSACETGLGKMYRGEGVVSIARAFASAGARSILQSQWTVSDAKTRHLMIYFYQNLKKGLSKDKALHLAKENYLQKFKGEEAHPYFWAGFVLVGQ